MIVLRISHGNDVVDRDIQHAQSSLQARRLVDPRRQNHDGAFVEDDLRLQPQFLNGAEHGGLMRRPGGDDRSTDGDRFYLSLHQLLDQTGWGRRGNHALVFIGWFVDDRAVLGDDKIEDL